MVANAADLAGVPAELAATRIANILSWAFRFAQPDTEC
jgi:hypothetical protein